MSELSLRYWRGLLIGQGEGVESYFEQDPRSNEWVAPAYKYRNIIERIRGERDVFDDQARQYAETPVTLRESFDARKEQTEALTAWIEAEGRGVVSLPTGGGKTILAMMAIAKVKRSTLIVVPTIDLVHQWHKAIKEWLGEEAGQLGGGEKTVLPITVSTYDSALIHMDKLGAAFGFLVVDECHHLAGPQNQLIAKATLAPYRLGLSATVERSDGGEQVIYELLGPQVYTANIQSMVGTALAPYRTQRILVELSEDERAAYDTARNDYLTFVKRFRINLGQPHGWQEFLAKASRLPGGREAIQGHRNQKLISQKAAAKYPAIWNIITRHKGERVILFTNDNDHAYRLGEYLAAPVLTHHTKPAERKRMLDLFRAGQITVLLTSKVLNEGVDVPEASVAIVASGSGAVREHVQRLGRVLRSRPGKEAVLYEILSENTSEISVNRRRREHHAYQGHAPISP